MWSLEREWYELVVRASSIFTFLFIVLRIWGRKHFGQLTPFDFILLLIMSEAVQNALVDDDKSIPAAFITIGTMIFLNIVLNKLTYHFRWAEKIIGGEGKVLVREGQVDKKMMRSATVTEQELQEALRKQGLLQLDDVGLAVLENNGEISVVRKEDMGFSRSTGSEH